MPVLLSLWVATLDLVTWNIQMVMGNELTFALVCEH
jgi:hypothetical protein